jgi:glycosyltransferase involved in cell wall biosynthesis
VISVIIPCFNQGAFLDEAVESVLAQTKGTWEIIIVNDGSTDPSTNEHLHDYRRPHTRVMSTPNRGLAAARNAALAVATGDYICALDADDALVPEYFARALPLLDGDPGLTFVSCWLETFGEESWTWTPERCDFPTLLDECTVCTAALVRTSAVRAIGGFDERMPIPGYEDWDLWIALVAAGHRGSIVPEVLFRYRRRAQSMSAVCGSPHGHATLMRYLIAKHLSAYEQHLHDLLLRKERTTARLLKDVYQLEHELHCTLLPTLERRRQELARLRVRTASHARDETNGAGPTLEEAHRLLDERSAALFETRAQIQALHESMSWRITRPLRRLYEVWLKFAAPVRGA